MPAPSFKLGLNFGSEPALKFASYFDIYKFPEPPKKFGKPWLVHEWLMLGNDIAGDCVLAGAAHETMLFCTEATGQTPLFESRGVIADYSNITGYVPGNDASDRGTDMDTAAKYRRNVGVIDGNGTRHKIDMYVDLTPRNLDQLATAAYIFGAVGVGVEITDKAMEQFSSGDVWTKVAGAKELGGHYIPCVGRNSAGNFLFVTWGRLQAATPEWVKYYMESGIAYLSAERLNAAGMSPQGFNRAQLETDFAEVTG